MKNSKTPKNKTPLKEDSLFQKLHQSLKLSLDKQKISIKIKWFQRLSVKLYGGLALFAAFILIISLFNWSSLLEVVNIQKTLVRENFPELALTGSLVQQSEKLIQTAPQLISSSSEKEIMEIKKELQEESLNLKQLMEKFEQSRFSNKDIPYKIKQMISNLESIEQSVSQKRKRQKRLNQLSQNITQLNRSIHKILVIEIDNKTFDLAVQTKTVKHLAKKKKPIRLKDILLYRQLLNLQAQTHIAAGLLREAAGLSNIDLIQPARERFLAAISAAKSALKIFPGHYTNLKDNIEHLSAAGLEDSDNLGVFSLKKEILEIEQSQQEYLKQNKMIAGKLSSLVKTFHQDIQQGGSQTILLFEKSLKKNQILLIFINGLSLAGSFVLAFFFIGPLVRRLAYLSKKMRKMSDGHLEEEVLAEGSDEVSEMAGALETFRRNALEVQRLGLVEKLAQQVQEKNKTLQDTINDLNKTRGQLVIQEKLASLGQLTSGIAHEIKNPLNFINNFSHLSGDLIKDLKEELDQVLGKDHKTEQESIQELLSDLQSNMEKISLHGSRVNDIITGMLQHSRGKSGSVELVDINKYMDTYSNLAFHSKRSLNSSFNTSFEKEYDPQLKPFKAVPQDISRIILNIITNACDAIEEKIKKNPEALGIIHLKTKKEGEKVKIVIQDNGIGMPDKIKEKIFNPFFTTKTTGQGTGLGLSLSHDIAAKHGGSLSVESEEGAFTKFTLTLPLTPQTDS